RLVHLDDVAYLQGIPGLTAQRQEQVQEPNKKAAKTPAPEGTSELNVKAADEKSNSDTQNESETSASADATEPAQSDSAATDSTPVAQPEGPDFGPLTIDNRVILGVASTSRGKTIREFHNQNHYNQWLFFYNPAADRGGLSTSPDQPVLNGGAQISSQQAPSSEQPNQ